MQWTQQMSVVYMYNCTNDCTLSLKAWNSKVFQILHHTLLVPTLHIDLTQAQLRTVYFALYKWTHYYYCKVKSWTFWHFFLMLISFLVRPSTCCCGTIFSFLVTSKCQRLVSGLTTKSISNVRSWAEVEKFNHTSNLSVPRILWGMEEGVKSRNFG